MRIRGRNPRYLLSVGVLTLLVTLAGTRAAPGATGSAAEEATLAHSRAPQGRFLLDLGRAVLPTSIASDGAHGFALAWEALVDGRLRARVQRFDVDGNRLPGWPAEGMLACSDTSGQSSPRLAYDENGGFLVTWYDSREGSTALYAQHLLANGSRAPGWPPEGKRILRGGPQYRYTMLADRAGGAYVYWYGTQAGEPSQIYLYRMTAAGDSAAGWPRSGLQVTHVAAPSSVSFGYLLPGPSENYVYITYVFNFDCYGHACFGYSTPVVQLYGLNGVAGSVTSSNFITARATISDGLGGLHSLLYWPPDNVLEHYGSRYAALPLPYSPSLLSADDMGGLLVEHDSGFFTRFDLTDTPSPFWGGLGGMRVLPSGFPTGAFRVARDGSNGFFFFWEDGRDRGPDKQWDLYATVVNEDGTNPPGWPATGRPISTRHPGLRLFTAVPAGPGQAIVLWADTNGGDYLLYGEHVTLGHPVPALLSRASVSASADGVGISWCAPAQAGEGAIVQRRSGTGDWTDLGPVQADGTGNDRFEDQTVQAGGSYEYRLVVGGVAGDAVSVEVPLVPSLSLAAALGNPTNGRARLRFSLPDARPASIELFDVAGRRVLRRELRGLGVGTHELTLDLRELPSAMYLACLRHPAGTRVVRLVLAR